MVNEASQSPTNMQQKDQDSQIDGTLINKNEFVS